MTENTQSVELWQGVAEGRGRRGCRGVSLLELSVFIEGAFDWFALLYDGIVTVPKLFQPCPVPSLLLPLSIPFPLHPSPNLALSLNTFRRAPKKQSELAINRNLIKLDNADYKMLQELFYFFVPQQQQQHMEATHCHATPPLPHTPCTWGQAASSRGFYEIVNNFICFQWQNICAARHEGRLTATRLPDTHPSTPPPLDSDSVALAVLLFSREETGCSACSSWFCWGLFMVEAACLELICCYRIVVAEEEQ